METILNFLRLTQAEREAFQAAAPDCEHLFRPVADQTKDARTASDEELARATVIIGCPPPPRWTRAPT